MPKDNEIFTQKSQLGSFGRDSGRDLSGLGAQRRFYSLRKTIDLCRQRASLTAIRCRRVRVQSRVAIGFGAVGGAGSIILIAIFLRTDSTIARADLGGPRGHVSLFNLLIPILPKVGDRFRRRDFPFRPYFSRAHPQDDVSCSATTPSNNIIVL